MARERAVLTAAKLRRPTGEKTWLIAPAVSRIRE
jgi:hypothetical protein